MTGPTAAPARPRPLSMASPRRAVAALASNVVLLVIAACFLVPLAWLFLASVDTAPSQQTRVPTDFTLEHYAAVLTPERTLLPLWNSTVLSAGSAIVTVIVAVLAAYPISRYNSRFNTPYLSAILFGTCLPITAIMVPVYSLFVRLGMLDNLAAVTFFLAATSLPMAIWMTKNFMDSVPVSLEEAAWVDGASAMRALRLIVLPLMRPGLAVVFIFVFIQAWGNFFVPFILLLSPSKQPASVSVFSFFGQYGTVAYGELAAYSLIYSLPVVVLYVIVSKGIGGSFAMQGAIKG
ncbi:multiple sugar transport system permease protein [Agromyces cerinus]|uniref:carbohydrate ABC transporter permease n=1 Tax=Agromyces cerinus TaxID=33878 RepID=UPI0035AC208F|nr:multiple sugar transport system permease protein [Agromyces cerinus]